MKSLDLIFFGRPMLIIPVWTVYLHFNAMNFAAGYGTVFPGREAIFHLIILTLIFKGVYVLNQIFDIESDRINDKLFFLPRGIISIRLAWIYYSVLTIAGAILALFVSRRAIGAVLAIAILGVLYSAPGIRLKDRPMWGLLANAAAYGFLIPMMAVTVNPGHFSISAVLPYFLAIAVGYILTTIPDHHGDLSAGKRTLAVIIGPKGALWTAILLTLTTVAASWLAGNMEMVLVAAVTLVCLLYLAMKFDFRVLMVACKFPILLLTLLAGSHYPFYPALLLLTIILTRVYYKKRFGIMYPRLSRG